AICYLSQSHRIENQLSPEVRIQEGGLVVTHQEPPERGEVALEDRLQPAAQTEAQAAQQPYLSVVIPVYNETKRLANSVPSLMSYFEAQDYSYEFVIADDGSSDGTPELARQLFASVKSLQVIESRPNRGKGHAVKVGML